MKDSSSSALDVISDTANTAAVDPGTFDFKHLLEQANAKGAETDEQRAEAAGISLSTYYRLQRGKANLTLQTLGEIAGRIDTTVGRLLGYES